MQNREEVEIFLKNKVEKIKEIQKEAELYKQDIKEDELPMPIYLGEESLPEEIMIHTCCAPCMIYPYKALRERGHKLFLYFFNPNIHPQAEWERRAEGTKVFAEKYDVPYELDGSSQEEKWLSFRTKYKDKHCQICYASRFFQAAKRCKELNYPGFTTSLTISPYQNHKQIHQTAERAAKLFGVKYYPFDFKPGFYQSQAFAKEEGIYRQKYCGCMYSIGESFYAKKIAKSHNLSFENLPTRLNRE